MCRGQSSLALGQHLTVTLSFKPLAPRQSLPPVSWLLKKSRTFCLLLRALTSRHILPRWAATQRWFPEVPLLFPGPRGLRSAVSGQVLWARPLYTPFFLVFQPCQAPAVLSSPGLSHRFLPPFIPAPTGSHILPWGPLPGPKKSVSALFPTSNISILKTHICIFMAPVPARQGYTLMHIYFGEEAFSCVAANFPLPFKCALWFWPDLLRAKTGFSQHL